MRYFIKFSYKGTNYHGWQIQPNAISVQEVLNKALSTVLNFPIDCMGAGRTDTGVHAREMFAHFDFEAAIDSHSLIHKLNSFLPKDIAVSGLYEVATDAHARFDATIRTYEYHINSEKNAFENNDSYYFKNNMNIDLMNKACKILIKYNDFESFSKVHTDVNTFNCKIETAFWTKTQDRLIFTISADRFLRNMVRAIVGTMINIGLEKVSLNEFIEIIESKNRTKAGFSVPAQGLYLTKVEYDYIK